MSGLRLQEQDKKPRNDKVDDWRDNKFVDRVVYTAPNKSLANGSQKNLPQPK